MYDNSLDENRPEFLKKLLEVTHKQTERNKNLYAQFISLSQAAVQDTKLSGVISPKLTIKSGKEDPETVSSATLRTIFNFYSKFQPPAGSQTLSFNERAIANETLSLFELVVFCRNFQVIPKLITKEELTFLWKTVNIERIKSGVGVKQVIDYEEFKLFLVRIAVFAYTKPGMLMLIDAICGKIPNHHEMVESLANYIHLNDSERVRQVIDSSGRLSATRFNFQSKLDQPSNIVSQELLHDVRARRLSQVLAADVGSRHEQRILALQTQLMHGISTPLYGEDSAIVLSHPYAHRDKRERGKKSEEEEQERMLVLSDYLIHNQGLKIATNIRARAKVMENTSKSGVLSNSDRIELFTMIARENEFSNPQFHERAHEKTEIILKKQKHENDSDDSYYYEEREREREDKKEKTKRDRPVFSLKKMAETPGALVSDAQEHALITFERSLSNYFNRYSKVIIGMGVTPTDHSVKHQQSEGPFADIGRVDAGQRLSIRIQLTNISSEQVEVDIITRDFGSDDVSITTLPKSFAPGLVSCATVTFTAPSVSQSFIGCVEVRAAPTRIITPVVVCCPIFFKVHKDYVPRPMSTAPSLSCSRQASQRYTDHYAYDKGELTLNSLPLLSQKYLGTKPKMDVSFEKNNKLWDNTQNNENLEGTVEIKTVRSPTRTVWSRQFKTNAEKKKNDMWQEKKAVFKFVEAFAPKEELNMLQGIRPRS
eukprot:CAMPEP_0182424852 /NCGR_PEP_ID=MMETSP1167-20130531/11112_1 /TAXON_ID=2988 /ORGANISM="Mallomonas Sp, Strain CCMP3275" /LENGTH=710 /DNA_ID=CAMNT_0024604971 /DNA_START=42 /DNA_END=2174 /DNA_ORIENTATION=+